MTERACAVAACTRSPKNGGRGYCPTHYARWRKHGDAGPAEIRKWGRNEGRSHRQVCTVEDCDRTVQGHGYCSMHYTRWRSHGDPTRKRGREPIPRRLSHNGYVLVWAPDHPFASHKRVAEHRLRIEESIGRILQPHESVHHKNGDRADNRLENLELWAAHHPNGQRVQDKIDAAVEYLRRYAPDKLR